MSDNPSRIERNQQICPYFARRECKRGRLCRNLHVITIDREKTYNQDDVPVTASSPPDLLLSPELESLSGAGEDPTKSRVNVSRNQPCRHYFQKGWCAFGEKCRFSHSAPEQDHFEDDKSASLVKTKQRDRRFYEEEDGSQSHVSSRKHADEHPAVHSGIARVKQLCKFYKYGSCSKGQRCKFWHPTASERTHDGRIVLTSNQSLVPIVTDVTASSDDGRGSLTVVDEKDLPSMRKTEMEQLRRRYPKAVENLTTDGGTGFQFTFVPTDPDWPYDVKEINMEVTFPTNYPQEKLEIHLTNNDRMPETVQRVVTELIEEWVTERHRLMACSGSTELSFRPLLHWLDKKLEDLLTEALKEFRREMLAAAAGVQFISARQLQKELYGSATATGPPLQGAPSSNDPAEQSDDILTSAEKVPEGNQADTIEVDPDEDKENTDRVAGNAASEPARRGTEVALLGLQFLDGAATLIATHVSLIVACHRCTNRTEVKMPVSRLNSLACGYCHAVQIVKFNAKLAHQFSSVIGFLDLESCDAFDLILADTQFNVGCIGCSKEMKIESLPPGPPNSTWCLHCHQKLTVAVNSVRFLKVAPSGQLDVGKACQVEGSKPVKAVRDPAIQEGKPLPEHGTCRHFKKSFRWLRFPCCGKAYPCDRCHNEMEPDHVMKFANRMICGFCAREQPYASGRPCVACQSCMTNRTTAHWEGGTGCRDKIKMSRTDDKKYANSSKTMSKSSGAKVDPGKKVTKLRHV